MLAVDLIIPVCIPNRQACTIPKLTHSPKYHLTSFAAEPSFAATVLCILRGVTKICTTYVYPFVYCDVWCHSCAELEPPRAGSICGVAPVIGHGQRRSCVQHMPDNLADLQDGHVLETPPCMQIPQQGSQPYYILPTQTGGTHFPSIPSTDI